jgi:hypothetical protein
MVEVLRLIAENSRNGLSAGKSDIEIGAKASSQGLSRPIYYCY